MTDQAFDILIIGGGPGGYVAAIRAAQLGFRTAIVERAHLGGVCLNWGCIPTKALLRSAEIYNHVRHASEFGLVVPSVSIDLDALIARSRSVAKRLNSGVAYLMKKNRVTVINGEAHIAAPGTVNVKGKDAGTFQAKHIIVATGARPRVLSGIEPDSNVIWTHVDALMPKQLPKSLLIIGSGAIGIEFASLYRTMGSEVTVVEQKSQILPSEDEEIAAIARRHLEKEGIRIVCNATVAKVDKNADGVVAHIDQGGATALTVGMERVISAVGVVGNIEKLGLEALGVRTECGTIITGDYGRTNVAGIYAIGDVAGPPMLAHKAEHEAVICVEAIKGQKPHPLDKSRIPSCVYCSPQIASVGLTEKRAREEGRQIRVGRFPFAGNGKAAALGESEGLIKTIFDSATGELIGAHMVGADVTELIHGFVVAMNCEATEEQLIQSVFPHPSLSEMMHESVLDAYQRVIHF